MGTEAPRSVAWPYTSLEERTSGNVEFLFPFPGLADNKAVRLSWFVDSGMVGDTYQLGDLRYSTGLAVSWNSPLGPLKISVAKALRSFPGDDKQALQFTFGTTF
jgi:outer membrane protein insertion porin family